MGSLQTIMKDISVIRNIPGNSPLIPTFRFFGVLKEGFYDMLKKNRIVKRFGNLSETHIPNRKSFDVLKEVMSANYATLDKDFASMVVVQLSLSRKLK